MQQLHVVEECGSVPFCNYPELLSDRMILKKGIQNGSLRMNLKVVQARAVVFSRESLLEFVSMGLNERWYVNGEAPAKVSFSFSLMK